MWQRKTPWFVAAATLSLAAGAASFVRPMTDQQAVARARTEPAMNTVNQAASLGQQLKSDWEEFSATIQPSAAAENVRSLTRRRDIYANIVSDVGAMLAAAKPQEAALRADAAALPPAEWRFFDLVSLTVEYQSPNGVIASGNAGTAVAAPQQQEEEEDPLAGGGGRSRPGTIGGGGSSRSRSRGDDSGTAGATGAATPYGKMIVTLVVDSTNAGLTAFVDETILAWLRENGTREGVPYTLTAPTPEQVVIAPASESKEGRADESSAARDEGALASGTLASLAPLPERERGFPADATVYRYTITFEAALADPVSGAPASGGDQSGGQEEGQYEGEFE